jgi:hypothetical protein
MIWPREQAGSAGPGAAGRLPRPGGPSPRCEEQMRTRRMVTSLIVPAYWKLESCPLQRRVRCEPVSRENSPSYVEKPRFPAGVRAGVSGAVDRDAQGPATSRGGAVVSLSGYIPVPHCRRYGSRQSGHRRQAWLARSGFSNIDKAKSRDRLKQNPAPHVYHWPGAADRARL